jgi:TonB-dependent receptor
MSDNIRFIRNLSLLFMLIIYAINGFAQTGSLTGTITGKVTDAENGEELIGAAVFIQGTTTGTITDLSGAYILENIQPGSYNIVVSYISYDNEIITVDIKEGNTVNADIKLRPATIGLEEVTVVQRRRTNTEMSVISSIKSAGMIVSGISAQQIAKTQDSDAAEVIRRVPGVTITDGRFVIVRGLIERYNSVLLNGASAPSFESDKKAFSFDAMPGGMIDNILIYKSPAPELPADFAGSAIDIITKSDVDENSLKLSYAASYAQNATFNKNFRTYKGGRYDWLGLDDGTRSIPDAVPSTDQFDELYVWSDLEEYRVKSKEITRISRAFNNIWSPVYESPFPDQNASLTLQKRFSIGRVSFGNITSLQYKHSNSYNEVTRREYYIYDSELDSTLMNFNFIDKRSQKNAEIGLVNNWNIIYGKNQKLKFYNFLNNMGKSITSTREGEDYYDVETVKATNLRYNSRFIYTGQLSGEQKINNERTNINWLLGFAYTKNKKPDDRRLYFVQDQDENYYLELQNQATNVKNGGRLYIDLFERIYNAGVDLEHELYPFIEGPSWTIKGGFFYEYKYREYDSRLIGLVTPRPQEAVNMYQPVDEIFKEENFFFDTINIRRAGLAYDDATKMKDSYDAENKLLAGYLGLKMSFFGKINIYGGARIEKYNRLLTGFYNKDMTTDMLDILKDTFNIFPSLNMTYNLSERHLLRFSYGKTINRPEFREMSITDYEDFDMNLIVHGNDTLRDAFIKNYDLRYEWYPRLGEMISIALFYKKFKDPIELFLIPSGTGYDYRPFNTEEAYSAGVELDVRKTLVEFQDAANLLRQLKNLTIIFNASFIKSEINTEKGFAREKSRIMQGQSPYIINLALFYNSIERGLSVNLVYNNIGERIAFAGTPLNPHTWELPGNSLDLTVVKNIGKRIGLKFGIKDMINNPVRFVQYFGLDDNIEVDTYKWIPNRKFSFGLSVNI